MRRTNEPNDRAAIEPKRRVTSLCHVGRALGGVARVLPYGHAPGEAGDQNDDARQSVYGGGRD